MRGRSILAIVMLPALSLFSAACTPSDPTAPTVGDSAAADASGEEVVVPSVIDAEPPAADGSPSDRAAESEQPLAALPSRESEADVPFVHRRTIELADLDTPRALLGARLFRENRISNPGSQYVASCKSCHQPQDSPEGARAYADRRPTSLVPAIGDDMKTTTARNTPALLDAALARRFNHDGQYQSLEETIREKIVGRTFGWTADQRGQAMDELHALILNDTGAGTSNDGAPYLSEFQAAYGIDLALSPREDIVDAIVTALADYVRLLRTPETSPYDALTYLNRFGTQLEPGEAPSDFSGRLFGRIANIEGRIQVKFPDGLDELEYQGFKIFMRTYQEGPEPGHVGNCVACHHPPKFSDFEFHNTGVAQMEYDSLHGVGAFARLEIPGSGVERPIADLGTPPAADNTSLVDFGYWNYVDLSDPTERKPGETDQQHLARTIGAFKTPPLRNLDLSDPYMHNGQYKTLEDAIRQKVAACRMARDGTLVSPDSALLAMDITEDDVAPLAAFLRALHEVDAAHFRGVVVENTRIRPAD